MKIVELNTQDHRCPEVMIMIRRFLKQHKGSGNQCRIITKEPSTVRDVPYYCHFEGIHILNQSTSPGSFEYLICDTKEKAFTTQQNIEIFNVDKYRLEQDKKLYEKFRALVADIKSLMRQGFYTCQICSFGKDSILVLTAALCAHTELMNDNAESFDPNTPFLVIHINTGAETVPMTFFSEYAMKMLKQYCKQHGINLELVYRQPPLHEQFVSIFVGARKLPSTPQLNSDCASILKVSQSVAIQRELVKKYDCEKLLCLLGSRDAEGAKRRQSISKFGNRERTVTSLLKKNENGIQTFTPIIDWSTEEVFELLQRAGSEPLIEPAAGYRFPTFMKSYRLLVAIYGDSAFDTCDLNLADTKSNAAGCSGKARNGCHQCLKTGKVDRSAVAHNQHTRWSHIQGNATKVRDYLFDIAHRMDKRTLHPRTFDPVTNHIILQPNILNSRTVERLLTLYVQLTHDDIIRSQKFKKLVAQGKEMDDPGYRNVALDTSMDELTKADYLDMYRTGAQLNVIQMATLEHCIYLSALWSMDGVKSLPFRPLAIWDSVVNHNRRIPWPNVNTELSTIDSIEEAITFKLCDPGVNLLEQWVPPNRPWDIFDEAVNNGCMTENQHSTLRIRVGFEKTEHGDRVSVTQNGKAIQLGPRTKSEIIDQANKRWAAKLDDVPIIYSSYLANRKELSIGKKVVLEGRKAKKIMGFTRRHSKWNSKKTTLIKGRTSLLMYEPREQSSLSESHFSETKIWCPDYATKVNPIMSLHQMDDEQESIKFLLNEESLSEWLDSDGLARCLHVYHLHLKHAKERRIKSDGRYTVRQFTGTTAFWDIVQSGLISVNNSTWHTCQKTLKRTELYHECGLFTLPDNFKNLIHHQQMVSMTQHRAIKAKELLKIRNKRNADRETTKYILQTIKNNSADPHQLILNLVIERITAINKIRDEVVSPFWVDCVLINDIGIAHFDHINFSTKARLGEDWIYDYFPALINANTFASRFCSFDEKRLLDGNALALLHIDKILKDYNEQYFSSMKAHIENWKTLIRQSSVLVNEVEYGKMNTNVSHKMKSILSSEECAFYGFEYIGHSVVRRMAFQEQTLWQLMSNSNDCLDYQWHEKRLTNLKSGLNSVETLLNKYGASNRISATKVSGLARMNALLSLAQ